MLASRTLAAVRLPPASHTRWPSNRAWSLCKGTRRCLMTPRDLLGACLMLCTSLRTRVNERRTEWAGVLALREPPGDAQGVKGVAARQLHNASAWVEFGKADPALAAAAVRCQAPRQPLHEVPLHDVLLRQSLVQLVEHVEVLGFQVAVHDFYDLLLEEPARQDHIMVAILICRATVQAHQRVLRGQAHRSTASWEHRPGQRPRSNT
mmetsp:Transcript_41648/g.115990  ORF Transcript_41648/g.115990 Transcript_41648/m.115990 type:complete len:207 (-) Transcript_41648:954-1574(-)